MRIDGELVRRGIYQSRTRAARAIADGLVSVDGKVVTKASFDVNPESVIEAKDDPVPYVGRGAFKLEGAFREFGISVEGKKCVDVGASTGGFTEVLLEKGALSVTAVDVGHGQLAPKLKNNPKVTNLESFDVRDFVKKEEYKGVADFVSVDVSFISLDRILYALSYILSDEGECVCLIKPQFEAGKKNVGKKGIVKSEAVRRQVLDNFREYSSPLFDIVRITDSPIEGGDGNKEYLALIKKKIVNKQ